MITKDLHLLHSNNGLSSTNAGTQEEHPSGLPDNYRPIIGVPISVLQGYQGPQLHADAVGAWAIERMGGRVMPIPLWPFPSHKYIYQSLWPLICAMDGLLLPASTQASNKYEHRGVPMNQPGPQNWSTAWEISLAQLATYVGMPVLAIGDGAERWNVALGGMHQTQTKRSKTVSPPDAWEHHTIQVRSQSKLAARIQYAAARDGIREDRQPWKLPFMPFRHVERLAPGLYSCAQSEEGTIVTFERRDSVFGLGMLARVDWGLNQRYSTVLFEAFLQACCSFASIARQQNKGWQALRDQICTTVLECVTQGRPLLPISTTLLEESHVRPRNPRDPISSSPQLLRTGRLRSHTPTREELNRVKRQRLKVTAEL